jgi:hypothetical protein
MSGLPDSPFEELARLRAQNAALQVEVDRLRAAASAAAQQAPLVAALSASGGEAHSGRVANGRALPPEPPASWDGLGHGLSKDQIARYSRQIILHSFGVQGASAGEGMPRRQRRARRARRARVGLPAPACSFSRP